MQRDLAGARRVRRAAVVEEAVLQRARAGQLLSDVLRLDVVYLGSSLRQFMMWLKRTDRTRWPHLLVLDLPRDAESLHELDLIAALRSAGMRVLVLSALRNRTAAQRLVEAGVDAIVSTADSEEDFLASAESALNGTKIITPRVRAALHAPSHAPKLSRQEERALILYAGGLQVAEVAAEIGVRQDTARKYLQRVRAKYALSGRPARTKLDLARLAWADGFIDPSAHRPRSPAAPDDTGGGGSGQG